MQTGWDRTALNPLVCKILVGTVAAGFLAVLIFHQPWVPVEISHAETGVLVAEPESASTVQWNVQESSENSIPQKEPIPLTLIQSPKQETKSQASPSQLRQTADVSFSQPKATVESQAPHKWKLGKPAVAYRLPEPFEVPASESELQWNFVIPTGVKRELFLTGLELRPGNKALVQRMVLSYDPTGTALNNDQQTPEAGFPSLDEIPIASSRILGEWTPGMPARPLPKESGYRIPAGADLVLTVDYAAAAEPALDPWAMGLHLSRSAPKHRLGKIELAVAQVASSEGHARMAAYRLPTDVILFSLIPERMRENCRVLAVAKTPKGQVIPLLEVENWESRWKNRYIFSQPIQLPKNSRLIVETRDPEPKTFGRTLPAGFCVFEVATPNPTHLEPLLQHNSSARPDF